MEINIEMEIMCYPNFIALEIELDKLVILFVFLIGPD